MAIVNLIPITLLRKWAFGAFTDYQGRKPPAETRSSWQGPSAHDPEPLWARNGGHGMILSTSDGQDYLVFHSPNDTPDERTALIRVAYSTDGVHLVQ